MREGASWIFVNDNHQKCRKRNSEEMAMQEFRRVLVAGLRKFFFDDCGNCVKMFYGENNYLQLLHFFPPVYFVCKYIAANEVLPCGQEELIQCSGQLRALTATSEFNFVDNKEELDRICPWVARLLQTSIEVSARNSSNFYVSSENISK